MKWFIGAILVVIAAVSAENDHCVLKGNLNVPQEWIDLKPDTNCVKKMHDQIKLEVKASLQYLAMGAYFSQDTINRGGFADFFFKAAGEEREHAYKLIEYLLMRGLFFGDGKDTLKGLIKVEPPKTVSWNSGLNALKEALQLEATVTSHIHEVIKTCEKEAGRNERNDYHLVDYLTGEFLEEQYHGQRELAGMVSTLQKMMNTQGPLGEFLFDKKIGA